MARVREAWKINGFVLANVLNSGHTIEVKGIKFHPKAIEFIRGQSPEIRQKVGESLRDLQKGLAIGMPKSRAMPSVFPGAAELRVKDVGTTTRIFYLAKMADFIVVFHGFEKDTQKTPRHEIEVGKRRLKEVLDGKV